MITRKRRTKYNLYYIYIKRIPTLHTLRIYYRTPPHFYHNIAISSLSKLKYLELQYFQNAIRKQKIIHFTASKNSLQDRNLVCIIKEGILF